MTVAMLSALLPPERTNLPLQPTSFVGREAEVTAVKHLLSDARLVTLTGAGGIGKTRLAIEVASQLIEEFADGVWLVELAALTDAELVPQTVLSALGFREQPGRTPTESLISVLADRELLCVLDNCEHLVEACARLADALLKQCPRVRMLATSQDRLGVGGETTWRVPSMATPDVQGAFGPDELLQCEAVQLFAQRAEAARPGFQFTTDGAASVARICRQLDGIPLAIELAAARTRVMSAATIEERLHDRFQLLTGGNRVSLPRQRTLQATLDWSHSLLNDSEKRLLRWLSVFRGGFTLEAAESVCAHGLSESIGAPVLDDLTSLVDKSLVTWEEGIDQPGRYKLLESIRQYGRDRLSDAEETEPAQRGHALYYVTLADQVCDELRGRHQPAWFARVEDELDNFRACFEWSHQHDPPAALRLTLALERYWDYNSRGEGRDWLRRAMEAAAGTDELRAHGLYNASFWALMDGSLGEARNLAGECLSLAQQLGNPLYTGHALSALAAVESEELREGWIAVALPLCDDAESYLRHADDPEALARQLNNIACTLQYAGDLARAKAKVDEALTLARGLDDTWMVAIFLESLANIEFDSGDTAAAAQHFRESLESAAVLRHPLYAARALLGLARVATIGEQPLLCLRLLGAAAELVKQVGVRPDPYNVRIATEAEEAARRLVGEELADAAWREGARMQFADAVRLGLGESIPTEPAVPQAAMASPDASDGTNTFVREGDFWSLAYDGTVVRVRDSKGLRDIARLLRTPGREVAAVDLARDERAGTSARAATIAEVGLAVETDAGEALDAEAREQYRARLADLEEEIAEADANNDTERASRAREEREFLLAELGAAVGLGGRVRRVLDPAERARKAVTGRVRDAISHIEKAHPALGRHLRRSLRTGTFCVYDPPEATAWQL